MTQTTGTQRSSGQADAIRPFHVNVPETDLTELRRRINATKWPCARNRYTRATRYIQIVKEVKPNSDFPVVVFLQRHGQHSN